jgi:hypothetical protein
MSSTLYYYQYPPSVPQVYQPQQPNNIADPIYNGPPPRRVGRISQSVTVPVNQRFASIGKQFGKNRIYQPLPPDPKMAEVASKIPVTSNTPRVVSVGGSVEIGGNYIRPMSAHQYPADDPRQYNKLKYDPEPSIPMDNMDWEPAPNMDWQPTYQQQQFNPADAEHVVQQTQQTANNNVVQNVIDQQDNDQGSTTGNGNTTVSMPVENQSEEEVTNQLSSLTTSTQAAAPLVPAPAPQAQADNMDVELPEKIQIVTSTPVMLITVGKLYNKMPVTYSMANNVVPYVQLDEPKNGDLTTLKNRIKAYFEKYPNLKKYSVYIQNYWKNTDKLQEILNHIHDTYYYGSDNDMIMANSTQ